MFKFVSTVLVTTMFVFFNPVLADDIGGSAVVDFHKGELEIPCVLVENLDESIDGMYFDARLIQRGGSPNWELIFAIPEPDRCDEIAEYAEIIDVDYDDNDDSEDDDPEEDDPEDDDTEDDDSEDDDLSDDDESGDEV